MEVSRKANYGLMLATLVLLIGLVWSIARLLAALQAFLNADPLSVVRKWSGSARRAAVGVFCCSCVLSSRGADIDTLVFALAIFALSEIDEAVSRDQLASRAQLTLSRSAPSVEAGGYMSLERLAYEPWFSQEQLAAAAADDEGGSEAEAEALRRLGCVAPDPRRQPGGLLAVLAVLPITAAADVAALHDHTAQLGGLTSAAAADWAVLPERLDAVARLLKLVAKFGFAYSVVRLRAQGRPPLLDHGRVRPGLCAQLLGLANGVLLFAAALSCGAALLPPSLTAGSFVNDETLSLLSDDGGSPQAQPSAGVASALSLLPAGVLPPSLVAWLGTAAPSFESTEADVVRLNAGPIALLAVGGSAVHLGSGGRHAALLMAFLALLTLLCSVAWVANGPLQLGMGDALMLYREAQVPARWAQLPVDALIAAALLLLLQMPIMLAAGLAALFSCSGRAGGGRMSTSFASGR